MPKELKNIRIKRVLYVQQKVKKAKYKKLRKNKQCSLVNEEITGREMIDMHFRRAIFFSFNLPLVLKACTKKKIT